MNHNIYSHIAYLSSSIQEVAFWSENIAVSFIEQKMMEQTRKILEGDSTSYGDVHGLPSKKLKLCENGTDANIKVFPESQEEQFKCENGADANIKVLPEIQEEQFK